MYVVKAVGTDLTEVARIKKALDRYGDRFKRRLFSDAETAYCDRKNTPAVHYAGRFAAKEAIIKILGTGFIDGLSFPNGASFKDIEVRRLASGKPEILLHGPLVAWAEECGIADIQISISHTREHAMAFALGQGPA